MERKKFFTSRNIAFLAVLTALVVVLQLWGSYIRIGGTNLSFVLVPIVLGAVMVGPLAGAFLGLLFGAIVIAMGVTSDPFTIFLFSQNPFGTVALCLLKGLAAGLVPGLLFKLIRRKSKYAAVIVASVAAPVCNTGIFILGCLMMSGTIGAYISSNEALSGMSVMYFLVIACAGINFLVEFAINVIASPVIFRVSEIVARVSRRSSSGAESEQSSADNAIESVRNCPECGAKIVVQGNVSECPYCGAPVQREGKSAEPNPAQAALPAREKPEK